MVAEQALANLVGQSEKRIGERKEAGGGRISAAAAASARRKQGGIRATARGGGGSGAGESSFAGRAPPRHRQVARPSSARVGSSRAAWGGAVGGAGAVAGGEPVFRQVARKRGRGQAAEPKATNSLKLESISSVHSTDFPPRTVTVKQYTPPMAVLSTRQAASGSSNAKGAKRAGPFVAKSRHQSPRATGGIRGNLRRDSRDPTAGGRAGKGSFVGGAGGSAFSSSPVAARQRAQRPRTAEPRRRRGTERQAQGKVKVKEEKAETRTTTPRRLYRKPERKNGDKEVPSARPRTAPLRRSNSRPSMRDLRKILTGL